MAKLPTLNDIAANSFQAISTYNANIAAIEAAFANTLSRDGSSPNAMDANLDMNSNNILNVGALNVTSITLAGEVVTSSVYTVADDSVTTDKIADDAVTADKVSFDYAVPVATRTALKAVDTSKNTAAILKEEGREGTFIWDSTVTVATHTADTAEGVYVAPDAGSDGAWVRIYSGPLNPTWFGATTDGADSNAAMLACVVFANAAKAAISWRGTVNVDISDASNSSVWMTISNSVAFLGEGRENTKLIFTYNGTAESKVASVFYLTGKNIIFRDMSLNFDVHEDSKHASLVLAMFSLRDGLEGLSITGCALDGHTYNDGSNAPDCNTRILWPQTTATVSRITLSNNKITNWKWGLIVDNAYSGVTSRIKILENEFDTFGALPLTFNMPNGTCFDVEIHGNSFTNMYDANGYDHCIAWTGPLNDKCHITGNRVFGTSGEFIHSEEHGHSFVVQNNVIEISGSNGTATGIFILANDVGGTVEYDEDVIITDNIIKFVGTPASTEYGIWLADGGNGQPADRYIISNNIIEGWYIGIFSASDRLFYHKINDNMIYNCNVGIYAERAHRDIRENTIKDCTTGLRSKYGGYFGFHTFAEDVTTILDTTESNSQTTLLGFSLTRELFTQSTSTSYYALCPATSTDRLSGELKSYVESPAAGGSRNIKHVAGWDGTTLTLTADSYLNSFGLGSHTFSGTPYRVNSGVLEVAVNNATAGSQDDTHICTIFEGDLIVRG